LVGVVLATFASVRAAQAHASGSDAPAQKVPEIRSLSEAAAPEAAAPEAAAPEAAAPEAAAPEAAAPEAAAPEAAAPEASAVAEQAPSEPTAASTASAPMQLPVDPSADAVSMPVTSGPLAATTQPAKAEAIAQPTRPAKHDRAAARTPSPSESTRLRYLGIVLDVGAPDGVMAGVAARPCPWFRGDISAGSNGIGLGVRAGLALRLPSVITPALIAEVGRHFEGNAKALAARFGADANAEWASAIGYNFVNLHTGVEFGSERSVFFLHGGFSYVTTELHHANDLLRNSATLPSNTHVRIDDDIKASLWVPSIKLGFLMYLV
jgi:hypothetical protein